MKDFMMYKKFTYENKSYKILEKKLQKEDTNTFTYNIKKTWISIKFKRISNLCCIG